MAILSKTSLAVTLDRISEALFYGRAIPKAEREEAAEWLVSRLGMPGAYAGMFAPTVRDFAEGIRLFTGEPLATRAGVGHVLGEEACRALARFGVRRPGIVRALDKAGREMILRLSGGRNRKAGTYCCGKCSAALWRNLTAGGFANQESLLAAGMRTLKTSRLGNGRWRRFSYWYTLLALEEIALPGAEAEMRYAAPGLERTLRRSPRGDRYDARRRTLAERILARV